MAQATYCTPRDLTVFGVPAEAIEDVSVDVNIVQTIEAASTWIDGYLKKRYTLPLVTFGVDIKRAAAILAASDVLFSRGIDPESASYKVLRQRQDDIVAWLELVGQGSVVPDVTDSSTSGPIGRPGRARITANSSRGWQTDSTRPAPFQGRR